MPRGFRNWTFYDVASFLKDFGFRLNHIQGSHHYYVGVYQGVVRQVTIPFHGRKAVHPKTMKSIVRQSGIAEALWLDSQK